MAKDRYITVISNNATSPVERMEVLTERVNKKAEEGYRVITPITDLQMYGTRHIACVMMKLEEAARTKEEPIASLGFSTRTTSALRYNGVKTVNDLLDVANDPAAPWKLENMRGIGAKGLSEIEEKLNELQRQQD